MASRRSSRITLFYSVAVAVVLFLAVNLLAGSQLSAWQLDLTSDRLFTVSKGTRQVLKSLDEPLHLRFFYSSEVAVGYPIVQSYAQRIKGLLRQYETLSHGKLKLDIIDPKPFTEDEDQAMALSIQPIPIDQDNKLFFGLAVTNSVDQSVPIPFFDPTREAFLEYELTRAIDKLKSTKQTHLGVLNWLPMQGTPQAMLSGQGPWVIFSQLQQFFHVDMLNNDVTKIPDDVDVLLVAFPAKITPLTTYAIDQYVLRGGKLILALDPHVEISGMSEKTATLPPLLKAWGVTMTTAVAADPEAAITVQTGSDVTSLRAVPNVTWLELKKDNFNASEVATSSLKLMRMATVGAFEPVKDKNALTLTPLITTSDSAFTVDPLKLMFGEQDPTLLMKSMTPSDHKLNLAVRLSGTAHTAFPGYESVGHLEQSKGSANVVLIGDTDFLRDGFWVNKQNVYGQMMFSPTADNGSFLLNMIDYLSGDSALIGLRTRSTETRDFAMVKKLRADAQARFRDEEERLKAKMGEIEQGLHDVQGQEDGKTLLSEQQQGAITKFRDEMLATRKQLRDVRHSLQDDIDRLGFKLKLLNIGLMPFLVLLLAFWLPRRLGMKRS